MWLYPIFVQRPRRDYLTLASANASRFQATWTADGKLWLRDFLPKTLPAARVLLFSYNANVAFETSTAGVREHGESF